MNNALAIFNYGSAQVRTVVIEGEPWFVAQDVCAVLGIETWHLKDRLDDDEKSYLGRTELGLKPGRPMLIINESGVYAAIMRSDKAEAVPFRRWVTHEVLPTIRKTGSYSVAQVQNQFPIPKTMVEALRMTADALEAEQQTAKENQKLVAMIEEDAPKVSYMEEVFDAVKNMPTLAEFGRTLKDKEGMPTGRNKIVNQLQ